MVWVKSSIGDQGLLNIRATYVHKKVSEIVRTEKLNRPRKIKDIRMWILKRTRKQKSFPYANRKQTKYILQTCLDIRERDRERGGKGEGREGERREGDRGEEVRER